MSNFKKTLILIAIVLIFLPLKTVSADAPPPSMDFEFYSQASGAMPTILSGTLYECSTTDCLNPTSIPITCGDTSCHAISVYSSYLLEIKFSDGKTLRSNVFQNNSTYTVYKVTIRSNDLLVETQSTSGYQSATGVIYLVTAICVVMACILLLAILLILFLIRRSHKKK
jgi:hypothetical protein